MKKDPKHRPILVLDEDPETLELMMEPLRWEGYDVRGLTSPSEVSEFINYWKPQMIIVDPDFSNYDGLAYLNSLSGHLDTTSLIVVSANSSTDRITQCLDLGASDYIVAPFVPLEFLARVRANGYKFCADLGPSKTKPGGDGKCPAGLEPFYLAHAQINYRSLTEMDGTKVIHNDEDGGSPAFLQSYLNTVASEEKILPMSCFKNPAKAVQSAIAALPPPRRQTAGSQNNNSGSRSNSGSHGVQFLGTQQ